MSINNRDLCHMFVHGWEDSRSEKNGSNLFVVDHSTDEYQHRIIYSYGRHWPLAIIHYPKGGPHLVVLNAESYSVSTSKHSSYVSYAIPNWYNTQRLSDIPGMADVMHGVDTILRTGNRDLLDNMVSSISRSVNEFEEFISNKTRITKAIEERHNKITRNYDSLVNIYNYCNLPSPFKYTIPSLESYFSENSVAERKADAAKERKKVALINTVRNESGVAYTVLQHAAGELFEMGCGDDLLAYGDALRTHCEEVFAIFDKYEPKANALGFSTEGLLQLPNYQKLYGELNDANSDLLRNTIRTLYDTYVRDANHIQQVAAWRSGMTNQRPYNSSEIILRLNNDKEYVVSEVEYVREQMGWDWPVIETV